VDLSFRVAHCHGLCLPLLGLSDWRFEV
jgi:hypothetical protein